MRLGGTFRTTGWLKTRLGGYYETAAPSARYASAASPDADKWGLGIGFGVALGRWELDLGYLHVLQAPRYIQADQTRVTQVNPTNPEGAVGVGGGSYSSRYHVVGLSLMARLGGEPENKIAPRAERADGEGQ